MELVLISPDFDVIKTTKGDDLEHALEYFNIHYYKSRPLNDSILRRYGSYLVYERTSVSLEYLGMFNQLYEV